MNRKRNRAFSLVELMVVITIIAMLAGGVAIALFSALGDARRAKAESDIADLGKAISLYRMKEGKLPETLEDLKKPIKGYPNGVVEEEIPQDPWGNDYDYQRAEGGYELRSLGADGAEGGEGDDEDISNKKRKEE